MEVYFLKKLILHRSDIREEMRAKTSKGVQSKTAENHRSFRPYTSQPISLKLQPNLGPGPIFVVYLEPEHWPGSLKTLQASQQLEGLTNLPCLHDASREPPRELPCTTGVRGFIPPQAMHSLCHAHVLGRFNCNYWSTTSILRDS